MKELIFKNPGALELNFIRVMGVSVKETDSAIGFFGTGLKYAIASILRLGGEIEIITQGKTYQFKTEDLEIRGKLFQQIKLNDELLPFTTELGKHWEAWMAIRELYSNAKDEGGEMLCDEDFDSYNDNETYIKVKGDAFLEVYENRRDYFISNDQKPTYSNHWLEAYSTGDTKEKSIFYKGIKIGEFILPTQYRYNIKTEVLLTEDRTYRYYSDIAEIIEKGILTSNDESYIRSCLVPQSGSFEASLGFLLPHASIEPSKEYMSTCNRLSAQMPRELNKYAIRWLERRQGATAQVEFIEPKRIQQKQIEKSLSCLRKLGYEKEIDLYPIKIASFLGEGIMGKALKGEIHLSRDCFEHGTKYLCSTILEEFVHIRHGLYDCTRELQTWLFDKIISLAEEFVIQDAL